MLTAGSNFICISSGVFLGGTLVCGAWGLRPGRTDRRTGELVLYGMNRGSPSQTGRENTGRISLCS